RQGGLFHSDGAYFAKAVRDASSVAAAAIIPSTRRRLIMNLFPFGRDSVAHNVVKIVCKRCDHVSFVIQTEHVMNGPTIEKLQRYNSRVREPTAPSVILMIDLGRPRRQPPS